MLVTDEFVEAVIAPVFDDSLVIKTMPHHKDYVLPVPTSRDRLQIRLEKYIVSGGYMVRFGMARHGGRRYIVSPGQLEKLPPVDEVPELALY